MRISYNFFNTLIEAKSVSIKSITRSFIMLHTMMDNRSKSFTTIWFFFWGNGPRIWCMLPRSQERDQNIRKTFLVFHHNMMMLLDKIQVKAGKTITKESPGSLSWSYFSVKHWLSLFILFSSCSITTSRMSQQHYLHKKWSFPLRIYPVNVTRFAGNCGFGHIYWRNL